MPLIQERERVHIKEILEKGMKEDVRLINFTQEFECGYCSETRELLEDLSQLSNRIKLEVYDFLRDSQKAREFGVDKIPATIIIGEKDYGIRLYGIPAGYEFASLLDDIVNVSQRTTKLSPATRERLRSVNRPVHIQVFVTPTCPYCPRAVTLAHQFAMESDFISADMVESTEFPQLANRYGVMAVPKVVINETVSFEGALPEPRFLDYVTLALEERDHT